MARPHLWGRPKPKTMRLLVRSAIGVGLTGLLILCLNIEKRPYLIKLQEGDVSIESIYAPFTYHYPGEIDEERTTLAREEARAAVREVFNLDEGLAASNSKQAKAFFDKVAEVRNEEIPPEKDRLQVLKERVDLKLSDSNLKTFLEMKAPALLQRVEVEVDEAISKISRQGVLENKDKKGLEARNVRKILARNKKGREEELNVAEVLAQEETGKAAEGFFKTAFPVERRLRLALVELTGMLLQPNLKYNDAETRARREEAAKAVPPQYTHLEIKRGELIIDKGQRVTEEHIVQLDALNKIRSGPSRFTYLLGTSLLVALLMLVLGIYFRVYEPKLFFSNSKLALAGLLILIVVISARVITYSPFTSYFIPVSCAAMLAAILLSPRPAIMITLMLSVISGVLAGDKFAVAAVSLVGGLVGIYMVRNVRRRTQILKAGFVVGAANFAGISAIGLMSNLQLDLIVNDGTWGLANGLVSAGAVMIFLPIFEYMFGIITNISLLELSDMNHPLLRDMILKAPGTYHHSLIVGNLSEAASETIGANALLARVASYYHDIGKTENPEYFSENQREPSSRHDKLTPTMSSLVIINHVKKGIELARKFRLNKAIIDFISQHHGTSIVYYFYQRALEEIEDVDTVKEEGFRYLGPKPQTRETAVTLLADSAEAASRALSHPTPARLSAMVRRVINNKFIDGQLDECELTLQDLHKIADAFVRVLTGVFHTRVEYPRGGE